MKNAETIAPVQNPSQNIGNTSFHIIPHGGE